MRIIVQNFAAQTVTLTQKGMEKKRYYHLYSDGFRSDSLFEDKPAFIAGMNIIALCFLKCAISIPAFCLMDNHVHFILYGTYEECERFKKKFIHRYSIWFFNRYSEKRLSNIDFDIKEIDDERYLLTSIPYVLRNSIASGYKFCIDDYPWSSGGLYFRLPDKLKMLTAGWRKISDLSTRELRRSIQTLDDLPGNWIISPEGFIWPGNYIDYKAVEQLYRTPKSFAFFMGQTKEEEINRSLGMHNEVCLPDMELREKAVTHCLRMFNTTNLRRLDSQKRIALARQLHKEYKCSSKQIARIIHLDPIYIKELV